MPTSPSKALQAKAALSIFESEYNKLNLAQKQAVDTIEGPVMVIAGPGTGKTQTVSMRVANILRKTQMRPSNILCLTFSVSGATAMRDRLRLLIGPDAYGVTVSTIHGFCQSVIDRHPEVFEEWSAGTQISDLERLQELNTILDQFSEQSDLINPKDPYGKNADILGRISQVKREGKSPEDLEKVAAEYDSVMTGKSRAGTKANEKNLASARKFHDFVKIFAAYQEMLTRTGRYDYDDMILHVLRALNNEEWMLESLQERFQYVLVDEVQDINGAQWRVIERLTTYDNLPHEPNLFLVGDDDQAIYRFQGANLAHMLAFHQRFPSAPIIPLTVSYRSTQAILSAAERLISCNEDRLVGKIPELEKHLTAASKEQGMDPVLLRSPSAEAEPWLIADLVERKIKEGIAPHEIAVLTQTNAELFPLFEVFRSRKIPVVMFGKTDLLSHPLVMQAMAILESVGHEHDDRSLHHALACACFGCSPSDLARLSFESREKKVPFGKMLLQIESGALPLHNVPSLIHARDVLLDLRERSSSRTVLQTVERALRESGLSPVDGSDPQQLDPLDLAAIEAFFQFAKNWCGDHPSQPFSSFLADLRVYNDPDYGSVRLRYELPHLVTEGVQLLTAHQSKGMEFDVVILSNFRDGHWDKRRNHSMVSLPEDLLFGWEKDQKAFEKHQDERRVAFVAMTRARKELFFVCPSLLAVGEKSRPVSPSAFFAEAGPLPEVEGTLADPARASLLLLRPVRALDAELKAYIQSRLETFALSATSLRRFLDDPQEFLRIDLLGQPEHLDEGSLRRLGFGSAAHWALKEWGTAKKDGKEFALADFLTAFEWYLDERTILTAKQRGDLRELGRETLSRYYRERLANSAPVVHAIERAHLVRYGDIPLKGKIDRIDLVSPASAMASVIDYKAGAPSTEREIRGGIDPGSVSRTEEGDRFRQLTFYALLLESADPLLRPESFALEFLGEKGGESERVSFAISDQEKDSLRQLIKDVWAKITALDFTPL